MNSEEIFSEVQSHQLNGIMFHEQMAEYYDFLGLTGFCHVHEKHFISETKSYRKLSRYYIEHYDHLLAPYQLQNPGVIPDSWYEYDRMDVDSSTRRNAVRDGYRAWVKWESDTKSLYSEAVGNLRDIGDIAGAIMIERLVKAVDSELSEAEAEMLELESAGYDLPYIAERQRGGVK